MGTSINMADQCSNDLTANIDPVSTGCGIYDFTGKDEFVWAELNCSTSAADVASMAACWWDGSSDQWSSNDDFATLCHDGLPGAAVKAGHKITGNGLKCMLMGRTEFGDGGSQHIITGRQGKKGIVVGHANFTCIVAYFDEEGGYPAGPCALAVEGLVSEYKDKGY